MLSWVFSNVGFFNKGDLHLWGGGECLAFQGEKNVISGFWKAESDSPALPTVIAGLHCRVKCGVLWGTLLWG